jgi:hypothetical protein
VIMAGDKLVISNNSGALLIASPIDGKVEKTFLVGKRISHSPAVVGNKIYLHILGKYVVDLVEVE